MTEATNLGIANVKVQLLDGTPNLAKSAKKYNFDISAYNFPVIENSPFTKPLLAEHIIDPNGTFACYHPSKRKFYMSNALDDGTATSTPGIILWTPLIDPPAGIPSDIVEDGGYDTYTESPPTTPGATIPSGYKGPWWEDIQIPMPPIPNDKLSIKGYWDWYGSEGGGTTTTTTESDDPWETVNSVHQKHHHDGLWWGIESDAFLNEENTPFWVTIRKKDAPSSGTHETCFIIRLGPDDPDNKFDIYISLNNRPRMIDYLESGTEGDSVPPTQMEWNNDLARVLSSKRADNDLEVGIMNVAGRLVIIANNIPMVYTRISREDGEDGGKLLECKIPEGKIQIFGTNVEASVLVSPMTFAELSIISLPLPTIIEDDDTVAVSYEGTDHKGDPRGCVAWLPKPPSYSEELYGVDCETFLGDGGSCSPTGSWYHLQGQIEFKNASASAYAILPNTDFYTLAMFPDSTTIVAGIEIPNGGCPYFFRLKGIAEFIETTGAGATDLSEYLISADETAQAPDYFHTKQNASFTFYNPDNIVGDLVLTDQTVFESSWGWSDVEGGGDPIKTFTGIVTSLTKSEIAGKETITLNCEDYIYVLKNVPIVNSPFYDGMVAYYAIKDLAERAGALTFIKDWDDEDEYFLPAGYSFSNPQMRFTSSQTIMDCITEMTKRYEAYVSFDGEGKFHINKLPGGLFSAPAGPPTVEFVSDFNVGGPGKTILEERTVDVDFNSTLNCINMLTLDRDTRNAIVYSKTASGAEDKLAFLKQTLINQPALGELEAAKAWAEDLSLRVFFPILKTRFQTTGTSVAQPLDFVNVDGHMFRVMSIKRSFVAETNDLNSAYECEWLGGA